MQLIVLGMHRSGTSSVTRLLNLAGAYFGPEGMATDPNEENPKGFWERRDIRAVCDGLLQGGGHEWWKVADLDLDRIPDDVRQEHVAAFARIVFDLDAHRPWVIKEPRLCLLAPLLRSTLEVPVFVHVVREPVEIARSLAARDDFPLPVGIALWEAYTVGALAASAGAPRLLVSYGDLLADPVGTTRLLLDQLGALGVQGLHMPTEQEITAFVSPSLHRQHEAVDARAALLNARQAALAAAADDGTLLTAALPTEVSSGALETLRVFEDKRALLVALEEQQASAEAARAQAEVEAAAERAQAEVSHQEAVAGLRASHQQAEAALRAEAAAAAADARRIDQQAVEALAGAERRIRVVKASGAVRLGGRLSGLKERLRGRRSVGVDGALDRALDHVQDARRTLESQLDTAPPLAVGPGAADPPPVAELRSRRRASRARGQRAKVAVLAWDVGHNPFGRAHLLADLLSDRYEVELWGSQFERYGSDVWAPLRQSRIPVRRFPGSTFPEFLDTMEDVARRIDADAIYVSKPRLPSLGLGVMAKQVWNRPLVVDIDDFEPSFFDELDGLRTGELLRRRGDEDLALPFGRLWTRACEAVVGAADVITVSNLELEGRYGGVVVPHARDEARFDPAVVDRGDARRRLGLRDDDRLILFGGTPRAHKGIIDVLQAVDVIGDERLRVGVFGTRELDGLRGEIGALSRWILPLPPRAFDELPELLAACDLACALQAPDHPVSRYQMPAKVTDALAMGVPCLVTAVPPLQPLIDKDVVEVFDGDIALHERLRQIFARPDETADRAARGREAFLESYSYAAVRPVAEAAIERCLEDPPPLAAELGGLVGAVRELFEPPRSRWRTSAAVTPSSSPAQRPHLEPGEVYDLVVFWKQNDTGIYGRRQDMFLKYLERSGRFDKIIHFDQPMSAEGLALTARRSIGTNDQNRLVLEQTLRRLAHRSDRGALRQRTFVYAAGSASRALRLPRRGDYTRYVRSVLQREGVGQRPLMLWVYPTNTYFPELVDALHPDVVVADVVDDNRTWYEEGNPARDQLERNYAAILERSDVVLANCEPVAESMRAFRARVDVVPNACELPDDAPSGRRPAELAGLSGPILGYAGNLSDRIDLELLHQLVRAHREWTFVILGSTHTDDAALALGREPNVRMVGTKRYDEAQAFIRHFDVALIPHLDNEMTRAMNPLKAFVYMSLGVPIVSTPVANLDSLSGHITFASGPEEFATAIAGALATGRQAPDPVALAPHSWNARVTDVLAIIDEVVSARPVAGAAPGSG